MRFVLGFAVVFGLGSCTGFPDLDDAISENAKRSNYPTLQPIESLLAAAPQDLSLEEGDRLDAMGARAERLARKASILRRPVLGAATRRRLRTVAARHAG